MSRHSFTADVQFDGVLLDSATVAYGYDRICGYFIQLFEADDQDVPVYDADSTFDGLSGPKMLDAFEEMGVYDRISEEFKTAMALDLPIPE